MLESSIRYCSLQFDLLNARALNTGIKEKIHCSLVSVNLALSYNNNVPKTLEWNRDGGAGHLHWIKLSKQKSCRPQMLLLLFQKMV